MANHPRTGVLLPRDLPARQIVEYARTAEELGFDDLWVVDPFAALAALGRTI
ncbi:hypothetical protein [Cellulomonas sp.]|uniref:hypothetical protein n=1 Tax=Cellulomonas sp. TaxID=40001 RepID=UPI001B25751E|nr:hypothetical protein [Cellulomonas sp.]MBO9554458.1 hypothetical protein [Cellulomonas sp.]